MASTAVARTQPEVVAPQITSVSHASAVSSEASAVPKKPDANCFTSTVSVGWRPRRASTSTACVPATSVRSDGILAMKTAAAWALAPS